MSIPRPEHPNPQFERKNWVNLNGQWQFEFDFGKSGIDRKFYERESLEKSIIVPFCPESRLSGIQYTDFIPAVWYQRKVTLTKEQTENNVFIHFGAVDYKSIIYINGTEVFRHKGGYSSFTVDITPYVKPGENKITVYAEDEVRSPLQPSGKQCSVYDSRGCSYTRTTGIWQTVWLEFVPKKYIQQFRFYPNVSQSRVGIYAKVVGSGSLTANVYFEGRLCGHDSVMVEHNIANMNIALSETHFWECGKGNLYTVELIFENDIVYSYFGLREVAIRDNKFILNGKSVFLRTVLDQGFYKDGIYTAKDEGELVQDIILSMKLGFNGARLHQKIFEPRFLYHCDRLGYLVWGEHANWGLDVSRPEALISFLPEWMETLERDFNHPAIIGWCPFNETWDYNGRKQIDDILAIVYQQTKYYDPTRPCIDTSGNYHVVTDIYDVHDYEQDVEKFDSKYNTLMTIGDFKENDMPDMHKRQHHIFKKGQAFFVSEFGGARWEDNKADDASWGYGNDPKTKEEFLSRYEGLVTCLLKNKEIMGFCYTQLYDVEQEKNGLYTYERNEKFNSDIIYKINTQKAAIED